MALEDIPFMDDKAADGTKEKQNTETSKISKESKVVKQVSAQNKASNVSKSNPRITSKVLPKSSQIKTTTAPKSNQTKSNQSRPASATDLPAKKEPSVRKPVSGVNASQKTKGSPTQASTDEVKRKTQTERRPISGGTKSNLAKSSTLQNKQQVKDSKSPTTKTPVRTEKGAKTPLTAARQKPDSGDKPKSKEGSAKSSCGKTGTTLKVTPKAAQTTGTGTSPKSNGVKSSLSHNSISKVKPGTQAPDVEFSKMSLSISTSTGVSLPPFNRQISQGDQLITFKDTLNPKTDFDQLSRLLDGSLDDKEKQCLNDLKEYLVKKEDAWILDQKLLNFIGGLLEHRSLNSEIRVKLLRLMAAGALRVDFWSFLQMDRKDRHLMKYPNDFEDLTVEEQKAVALFLCNNFSSSRGSEWLLYGSPWKLNEKQETSNVKITSKVAAFSLVSYTPSLQNYGSAMIYNIALKEAKAMAVPVDKYTEEGLPTIQLDYGSVSDKDILSNSTNGLSDTKFVTLKVYNDVAVELCMAILKFIKKTKNPDEEILYRCVKSLLKFSLILKQDLLSCIAMVQTDLDEQIPGKSDRIDTLWTQLRKQLLNNS